MSTQSTTTEPTATRAADSAMEMALETMTREQLADLVRRMATSGVQPTTPVKRMKVADLIEPAEKKLRSQDSARTYRTYWNVLCDGLPETDSRPALPGLGDEWADEITTVQLQGVVSEIVARAKTEGQRRNEIRQAVGRAAVEANGTGAEYNAVGAIRAVFTAAVQAKALRAEDNPARDLHKPGKLISQTRRMLLQSEADELYATACGGGNDPDLDAMIIRFLLVTGARREGLLNLTLGGVSEQLCTVRLDEKRGKVTHQPVPDWHARELMAFARSRGARVAGDKVFRQRDGQPMSRKRFETLFGRIQASLEWADRDGVTAHFLRHHAISVVERRAGKSVAIAFARHVPSDVNGNYTKADKAEVAKAVVGLYGGTHPLLEG